MAARADDRGRHARAAASRAGRRCRGGGKVIDDLVDSTDFPADAVEAAGASIPAELKLDGRSFLPQLRGEKGQPREWFYCWYAPNGGAKADHEFAANHRYKLYRTAHLYDWSADLDEAKALDLSRLPAAATGAHKMLQGVLDDFKDARPGHLSKVMKKKKAK